MMSFSMRLWFRSYATVGALLLVCIVFAFLSPQAFATFDNAINVTRQIAFLVLIAVGATFVMAAGEFDLSVGAMASFAGVMAAQLRGPMEQMLFCRLR
jgi:ribose transport system permease protein